MKLMILGFEICHFDAKKESKEDPKEGHWWLLLSQAHLPMRSIVSNFLFDFCTNITNIPRILICP